MMDVLACSEDKILLSFYVDNLFSFQHAARCLTNQDWVRSDSLKTVENTAVSVFLLLVH